MRGHECAAEFTSFVLSEPRQTYCTIVLLHIASLRKFSQHKPPALCRVIPPRIRAPSMRIRPRLHPRRHRLRLVRLQD